MRSRWWDGAKQFAASVVVVAAIGGICKSGGCGGEFGMGINRPLAPMKTVVHDRDRCPTCRWLRENRGLEMRTEP